MPDNDNTGKWYKFQFGGPDKDRYRLNWWKLALALGLMIATGVAMNLRDHNHDLYTGWSLFGLLAVVVGLIIILILLIFANEKEKSWPVYAAFALGIIVTIGIIKFLEVTNVSAKAMGAGVATFTVIGGCLIGLTLTKWWRPE